MFLFQRIKLYPFGFNYLLRISFKGGPIDFQTGEKHSTGDSGIRLFGRYCSLKFSLVRMRSPVRIRPSAPALHVSFDTKLACSFLLFGCIDYAEMNLFAVNLAHFRIFHFLSCKSVSLFRLCYLSPHPVFSPISCRSRIRYGVLPLSVDKC